MQGAQLARALADLSSTKPDLDAKLAAALGKLVKDSIGKLTTLSDFRGASKNGRGELIGLYLAGLTQPDLAKLAKKLDPHHTPQPLGDAARIHIQSLVRGEREPAEKAAKSKAPMPIEGILALSDAILRRAELAKHTPAKLKSAIKDKDIDATQLSSKPSKTELIEHIEAAIASGWPRARSILDDNKH
ncbi:MAG: hypothetical protein AB7O44_19975 [Hyphomicrobiaceae bacterium]